MREYIIPKYQCEDGLARIALGDEITYYLDFETNLPDDVEFDSSVVGLVDSCDIADTNYDVPYAVYQITDLGEGNLHFAMVSSIDEMIDRLYALRIFKAKEFRRVYEKMMQDYDDAIENQY